MQIENEIIFKIIFFIGDFYNCLFTYFLQYIVYNLNKRLFYRGNMRHIGWKPRVYLAVTKLCYVSVFHALFHTCFIYSYSMVSYRVGNSWRYDNIINNNIIYLNHEKITFSVKKKMFNTHLLIIIATFIFYIL